MKKICSKCSEEKIFDEFYSNKRGKNGKRSQCKFCFNFLRKEYRKKYPWKVVFNHIKQRCNNPNDKRYKDWGGRGIKCLITAEELKELWFRDKAWLLQKPSIDRKNNNGDYIFENCKFIEMSINTIKDRYKPINQYDLEGNFIRSWKGAVEIENLLGFANQNISKVCLGKRKTANRFIWRYSNG